MGDTSSLRSLEIKLALPPNVLRKRRLVSHYTKKRDHRSRDERCPRKQN